MFSVNINILFYFINFNIITPVFLQCVIALCFFYIVYIFVGEERLIRAPKV